eukprot:TRINITY_DN4286_c0_g4_i1.p1 TRINITY_DN4286_c0_g4~~TRINITY_DN4286_c0_g4_i1.p1  ORF type:complete len:294 (-),score=41.76 TRINITY_DN4286_c0_g4_i1:135-1016(-)
MTLTVEVCCVDGARDIISGLRGDDSLHTLADKIACRCGVPEAEQRLVLSDGSPLDHLSDPRSSLASLGISDGTVLTVVRVGVPQSGVYTGSAAYEASGYAYEVTLDCSSWRWTSIAHSELEIEIAYKVLRHPTASNINRQAIEVMQGSYDWDAATLHLHGLFMKPVSVEGHKERPSWLSLPRPGLVQAGFELCRNGRSTVDQEGLHLWVNGLGFDGNDEDWEIEYIGICGQFDADETEGLTFDQFQGFIELQELTDLDLREVLGSLDGSCKLADGTNVSDYIGHFRCTVQLSS